MKNEDGRVLFLTILIFGIISAFIVLYTKTNVVKIIVDFFVSLYNGLRSLFG